MTLAEIVQDFGHAFKEIDAARPCGKSKTRVYSPGIGPLQEAEAIARAVALLARSKPQVYQSAGPQSYPSSRLKCDLVIPGDWAIEFKLARPFGDNGKEAEHWSENILHPYPGSTSAVGDAIKLLTKPLFAERKAVVIFGYEHNPAVISLETAVRCFELICTEVLRINLSPRERVRVEGLVHPCHQQLVVYGWELQAP